MAQVLRNSYASIYYPIFFLVFGIQFIYLLKNGIIFNAQSNLKLLMWIFFLLTFYVSFLTFVHAGLNDLLKAFPRMIIMPLSFLLFYNFCKEDETFYKLLNILVFFTIIASLSLVYQVFYGPIDFLVKSSMRLGLERYASTFGSLTIYGGAVGIVSLIVLKSNYSFFLKLLIISLFVVSSLITLSKAALVNLLLAFFIYIFLTKNNNKFVFLFGIFSFVSSAYFLFPEIGEYFSKSFEGLGFNNERNNSYDNDNYSSLINQIFKRVFEAPIYLSMFSIVDIFFGFGLIGGQGAFGLPYSFTGTTHNQLADLFLIGGIFLFLIVVLILIHLLNDLSKIKPNNKLAETFYYCMVLTVINMFFFNGFMFQPITSFVFWLSIVYVINFKQNQK